MAEALNLVLAMTLKDAVSEGLGGIGQKFGGLGQAVAGFGIGAVAAVGAVANQLVDCVKAADEENKGIVKLGQAVKNTGADWGTASGAIEKYLAAETKRTALDDGEGREALTKLVAATGDYKEALGLMGAAQDLAAGTGMSLAQAAQMLGKIDDGNTASLKRYGIALEKGATATQAMAAVQQAFGGQAEAQSQGMEGQMKRLDIAMGNVKETIGGALLPLITPLLEKFAAFATDAIPLVEAAAAQLGAVLGPIFTGIGAVIGPLFDNLIPQVVGFFTAVSTGGPAAFGPLQGIIEQVAPVVTGFFNEIMALVQANLPAIQNIVQGVMAVIAALIPPALQAIKAVWDIVWPYLKIALELVWNNIKAIVTAAIAIIQSVINIVLAAIKGDWGTVWQEVQNIAETLWNLIWTLISNYINAIWQVIQTVLGQIRGVWEQVWGGIHTFLVGVWDNIKAAVSTAIDAVKTTVETVLGAIKTAWETGWNAVKDFVSTTWDNIKTAVTDGIAAIKLKFTDSVADMIQLGKDMINGLWRGIEETARNFADAAKRLVQQIIGSAREGADAHSPSKEMEKLGRDIGAGLTIGMQRSEADVTAAARDLMQNAKGAMGGALGWDTAAGGSGVGTGWRGQAGDTRNYSPQLAPAQAAAPSGGGGVMTLIVKFVSDVGTAIGEVSIAMKDGETKGANIRLSSVGV